MSTILNSWIFSDPREGSIGQPLTFVEKLRYFLCPELFGIVWADENVVRFFLELVYGFIFYHIYVLIFIISSFLSKMVFAVLQLTAVTGCSFSKCN